MSGRRAVAGAGLGLVVVLAGIAPVAGAQQAGPGPPPCPVARAPEAAAGPGRDVTNRAFEPGPLTRGAGLVERTGETLRVVSSAEVDTYVRLSSEPASGFAAWVRFRSEPGLGAASLVGLFVATTDGPALAPGDLFFGADAAGHVVLARRTGEEWVGLELTCALPAGRRIETLGVERGEGCYLFGVNGIEVGRADLSPASRRPSDWVHFFVRAGARADLLDWRVTRRETAAD